MVTLHEVITFLVSMQISISSLQTHNVNRCGRSRHLARKLSLRRKRSSPNVFEMAATETITSIILIKLIRVSLGTVRHPRRFKIVVIDIQITLKQMLRDFIGIRVNRAKKSGMVNITSRVNSRQMSGINTMLHELNPLFTINVTMRDIKSKKVYSRVNSKATTQWRKTERAHVVHLVFFFSSRRRHTRLQGDWSSDVCSSDLPQGIAGPPSIFNLTYVQTIFNGPLRGEFRAAEERAEGQRLAFESTRDAVIVRSASACLELAKVRRSLDLLRQERESAQRIVDITREPLGAGVELPIEVTRAQLTAARIEQRIVHRAGREEALEGDMRGLLRLPTNQRLEVAPEELPASADQPVRELV